MIRIEIRIQPSFCPQNCSIFTRNALAFVYSFATLNIRHSFRQRQKSSVNKHYLTFCVTTRTRCVICVSGSSMQLTDKADEFALQSNT